MVERHIRDILSSWYNLFIHVVFRINLLSLIPVIGQLMRVTCSMVSIPKRSKGFRYAVFKILIFTQIAQFKNF